MDGQEIARVVELGDDRELLVEPADDISRNPFRIEVLGITPFRALPGEIGEMLLRGLAGRHRLVGIFVFEFFQRKAAGLRNRHAARDRARKGRKQPRHLGRRLEVTLGIGGELEACFRDGAFLANAGEDVGERPALRRVIMHIVDGDEWRARARAERIKEARQRGSSPR